MFRAEGTPKPSLRTPASIRARRPAGVSTPEYPDAKGVPPLRIPAQPCAGWMPPEPCRSGLAIGSCHPRYPGTGLNNPARGRPPVARPNRGARPILLLPCQIRPLASKISNASKCPGRPARLPPPNGVAGLGQRARLSPCRRTDRRVRLRCNRQWQNQWPGQAPCLRLPCGRLWRLGALRQKRGTPPVAAMGCRLWPHPTTLSSSIQHRQMAVQFPRMGGQPAGRKRRPDHQHCRHPG